MPALERVLRQLEADAAAWDVFVQRVKAADENGLQPPEGPEVTLWQLLCFLALATENATSEERARLAGVLQARRHPLPAPIVLRDHHGRERGLPLTIEPEDILRWLVGEALAAGIGCDYATPQQAWTVLAELVLRDDDIGEIIARVHPERLRRKTTTSEIDNRKQNADLAGDARKRVNAKRSAWGYRRG